MKLVVLALATLAGGCTVNRYYGSGPTPANYNVGSGYGKPVYSQSYYGNDGYDDSGGDATVGKGKPVAHNPTPKKDPPAAKDPPKRKKPGAGKPKDDGPRRTPATDDGKKPTRTTPKELKPTRKPEDESPNRTPDAIPKNEIKPTKEIKPTRKPDPEPKRTARPLDGQTIKQRPDRGVKPVRSPIERPRLTTARRPEAIKPTHTAVEPKRTKISVAR